MCAFWREIKITGRAPQLENYDTVLYQVVEGYPSRDTQGYSVANVKEINRHCRITLWAARCTPMSRYRTVLRSHGIVPHIDGDRCRHATRRCKTEYTVCTSTEGSNKVQNQSIHSTSRETGVPSTFFSSANRFLVGFSFQLE